MKKVAILTDFVSHDPAYSLCGVVANQVKMLVKGGYEPRVFVREGTWNTFGSVYGDFENLFILDPGEIGSNVINITDNSEYEIDSLARHMKGGLEEFDVVLTHDLIYQANMWKYHVAARRAAKELPNLQWLHWVHSSTDMGVRDQLGKFRSEIVGKFPNSRLVAMHHEEILRKGHLYGYEDNEIVVIPNPIDFTEDYHEVAKKVIEGVGLYICDVIAIYPARLDRGKQPHIIVQVFEILRQMGFIAKLIIVDFHSTEGDKDKYREEMKSPAVFFTSKIEGCEYTIPHKAVMDLFEYSDVFIHPSRSESDPLTVPEAAWKKCGLILNYDLPVFRQYDGKALFYKFSSNIDVLTGLPGTTETKYDNVKDYLTMVASGIIYQMQNNPVLSLHAQMRKERSLDAVWRTRLLPAIEGGKDEVRV